MRLLKLGHSCVRIETGADRGGVVVIDPGTFTDPGATDGATAVLITHEHPDHWSPEQLRATDAPIHTIAAVADRIRSESPDLADRLHVLAPGDRLDVGVPVTVVGEKHAVIHPELPHFDNSGYLLDLDGLSVFHPGDSLTVPEQAVDLLLLPVSAPWLKVSECIDYARDVGAPRSFAIHDLIYSELGLGTVSGQLERFLGERGQAYARVRAGQDVPLTQ